MSWTVWGVRYDSDADFTNGVHSLRFKPTNNMLLRYIRQWFIFYNDPTFTNLTMSLHIDEDGEIGDKIHDSTKTWTKAEILTLDNGVNEIYFTFDDVSLVGGQWYHIVPKGTGSSFTDSSYVALKTSYPTPVYRTGLNITYLQALRLPFDATIIGAEF